jgi:hypothetical protein
MWRGTRPAGWCSPQLDDQSGNDACQGKDGDCDAKEFEPLERMPFFSARTVHPFIPRIIFGLAASVIMPHFAAEAVWIFLGVQSFHGRQRQSDAQRHQRCSPSNYNPWNGFFSATARLVPEKMPDRLSQNQANNPASSHTGNA